MNEILLSKLTQRISGVLFWIFAAVAGFCGVEAPATTELTSSVQFVASFLAACFFAGVNRIINAARTSEPPAEKYNGPLLIALLLLPALLTGCGVDRRVDRAVKSTSNHIENAKKNSGSLTEQVALAYEHEAKEHIDTKYKWDAEKVVTQAEKNPAITPRQIVDEMMVKTAVRDEKRARVEIQTAKVRAAQGVVEKDLNNALRINEKVLEYVNEPGFDFIAFVQGIFGKEEEELPETAGVLPAAEIVPLPPANPIPPVK